MNISTVHGIPITIDQLTGLLNYFPAYKDDIILTIDRFNGFESHPLANYEILIVSPEEYYLVLDRMDYSYKDILEQSRRIGFPFEDDIRNFKQFVKNFDDNFPIDIDLYGLYLVTIK